MRILFTICGRAGSKGIKNKNLSVFCGKYLAHITVSAIGLYLDRHPEIEADVVINSDSIELIQLIDDNGMIKVEHIIRDKSLSGDTVGKIAVIHDCLVRMERLKTYHYDMVVDLDITSPLRTVQDLENVINKHAEKNADVTTTVAHARRNPFFNQVKKTGKGYKRVIESSFTARQQAPEIFDMNASIYAYNPEFLASEKGVLDGYCEVVEMYDTGILDLDHKNDYELMEVIAKHLYATDDRFGEVYARCIEVSSDPGEKE